MAVLLSGAFWAPVKFVTMGDDLKKDALVFRARWKRLKRSERKAMDEKLAEAARVSQQGDGKPVFTDEEFLKEMLVDWDLRDVNGQAIPYTTSALAEVCEECDGLEATLVLSYFDARRTLNQPEVVAKNSDAPSDITS